MNQTQLKTPSFEHPEGSHEPAMTPQQRQVSKGQSLSTYKNILVGEKGWAFFFVFELYNLFLSWIPSFFGIGARRLFLPRFLRKCARGLVVGSGVTIRCPNRISIGRGVVIDDDALVDVRPSNKENDNAELIIGNRVYIGRQSIVTAKYGKIHLSDGCNIGSACRIATQSSVEIGESVLIAAYVYIGGANHRAESLDTPIMEQGMELHGGVKIGSNSWIGTKATIVEGVTIGKDAVVGAHSLVKDNVPDRAIVAGIPAKIIRFRE